MKLTLQSKSNHSRCPRFWASFLKFTEHFVILCSHFKSFLCVFVLCVLLSENPAQATSTHTLGSTWKVSISTLNIRFYHQIPQSTCQHVKCALYLLNTYLALIYSFDLLDNKSQSSDTCPLQNYFCWSVFYDFLSQKKKNQQCSDQHQHHYTNSAWRISLQYESRNHKTQNFQRMVVAQHQA